MAYVLVFLVALLNVLNVSLYKIGVERAGGIALGDFLHPWLIARKVVTTPYLMLGFLSSVCTTFAWLATLTRMAANVAVPLMNGIFYVVLLAISIVLLGESVDLRKVIAIGLIFVGAMMLV